MFSTTIMAVVVAPFLVHPSTNGGTLAALSSLQQQQFLESLEPLIEQEIEKSDYPVFKLNFLK
jgi:hypothetical protein